MATQQIFDVKITYGTTGNRTSSSIYEAIKAKNSENACRIAEGYLREDTAAGLKKMAKIDSFEVACTGEYEVLGNAAYWLVGGAALMVGAALTVIFGFVPALVLVAGTILFLFRG